MKDKHRPKYYLVEAAVLPEVFTKVMDAKRLLETGEADTVAEAAARVDLSRSAFYKYKDSISIFQDISKGHMITFSMLLRDETGILSQVLTVFAGSGVNILTINQNIPVNGVAVVTVSAETSDMVISLEELLAEIDSAEGVIKADILAG